MKKLVMMLVATSLLICAAPYGRTDPAPNAAKKDKHGGAKMAEEKGDLARVHERLSQSAAYYYDGPSRSTRQNADAL